MAKQYLTHKFGAHLSIAGGYENPINEIVQKGGNCLQIFSVSPRGWHFVKLSPEQIESFKKTKQEHAIDPIYFHASYLVNLADDGRIAALSKQLLIHELRIAHELGIKGSIVHLGSYKNNQLSISNTQSNPKYKLLIQNIQEVLEKTPEDTFFIIENAGNRKIGQSLEEIKSIIGDVEDSKRLRICLDTCHLFSAGYDLRTNEQLDSFLNKFDNLIGLKRLELWHINDSRDALNSGHDRHENIGQGFIGIEEFRHVINHPRLSHLPFIIETPGFDKKGPDKKNLDILKSLLRPS